MKGFTKGSGKGKKFIPTKNKKQGLSKSQIKHQHEDDRIGKTLPLTRRKESLDDEKKVPKALAGASTIYLNYLEKFPDSKIAEDVNSWLSHGDNFRGNHGHFGQALRDGDIEKAMYRADADNLVKLHELGIENHLSNTKDHPDDESPKDEFLNRYKWAKEYIKSDEYKKMR